MISTPDGHELSEDDFDTIVQCVSGWLPRTVRKAVLVPTNPTHRLLLIADIVDLFLVCPIAEIKEALGHFNVEMDEASIIKSLKLLDFFQYVKLEMRGETPYAVRRQNGKAPWVNYKATKDKIFVRERFKADCSLKWVELDRGLRALYERRQ